MSSSISVSYHLGDALIVSVISFIILLVIEAVVHFIIRRFAAFDIDGGMQQGKIGYGLFSGTLHMVGALIISASL